MGLAMFQPYENPGWGSAIVDAQLAMLGLPYTLIAAGECLTTPSHGRLWRGSILWRNCQR